MQRISPVTRLKILINPQKYQRITTTVSKPYRVVRLKDLSNSKFPRIYANIHEKARLHRRREPSSPVTKFSEFHRRNWVEEISDKETRQRSQTLLYHSTAPDRDKEKKPPLSACCSARFTFRPFLLLLSKNSTAFCPKEATDETRFPSYSRKVGRKAETREILRESLSQPPPLLDGRNVFFQGHAESSGSVSSTFILPLDFHPPARLFVTGDGASRVWLFDSLLLWKIGDRGMRVEFCERLLLWREKREGSAMEWRCDD